jgi:methionyl-tRNA synthetase
MRFYLTTPIYYVNAEPSIGNAYTTVAADIVVRHRRQRGDETFFLTGVDEHSTRVYRVAQEQGLDPYEYLDQIAVRWRELPERLNASIDFFIRTSDEGHKAFVREFLQRIYDNGDIYEGVYAGFYCVRCEAFYAADDLIEGKCPIHGIDPEWIEEKNYFFRLSAYQERLLQVFDERPDFVRPANRYNEARAFIAGGLSDFSISRAGQPWGIPLPWDESQVAYVWADALVNYLSALTYARPGEDLRETFWPVVHHFVGKDILRFHAVYWPAMLLSAGYELPQTVLAHGWLLFGDEKISKTNPLVQALNLTERYGGDAIRFWCARAIPFPQDGSASLESIGERYETELANDLGNLVSRTTAMISRYRGGALAKAPGTGAFDAEALRLTIAEQFDRYDISGALESIWLAVRALNQYVESNAPWNLAKDEARAEDLDRVLYDLADGLVAVAVALSPYLPETAPRILEALRQPTDLSLDRVAAGVAEATEGIEAAAPLFPRVEEPPASADAAA